MWGFFFIIAVSGVRANPVQSHCLRFVRGLTHAVFAYPDGGLTMKEIKDFHSALAKATKDTTHFMSAHLRSEAEASGWPSHVVRGLHVKYEDSKFQAHVADRHVAEAKNLEYGTPSTQPTAAVRRFANRPEESGKFLVGRLSHHLGEL
jgi:hypothetical protein